MNEFVRYVSVKKICPITRLPYQTIAAVKVKVPASVLAQKAEMEAEFDQAADREAGAIMRSNGYRRRVVRRK